jgi:catecholate siderophore receptor
MSSRTRASNTSAEIDNDLTLTPRHTLNLWSTFRLPWEASIGGGVQHMDAVFRNALNTTGVPAYTVVSAMAAKDVSRLLTLRLNANNLANAQYVDRVGGGHFIPGAGRSASLTAGFRF